jgi:hypothetical protein
MGWSRRQPTPSASGSLTPTVTLFATIVLVVLTAVVPISGFLGGPLLLLLGVRARREARSVGTSTVPAELALLAGLLVTVFSFLMAGLLGWLLAAIGRGPVLSPSPVAVP